MLMTTEQNEWFQRMRGEWLRVMRPLEGYGPSSLFPRLRILPAENLAECQLLPSREHLFEKLPKGGKVIEVGTQEGLFARFILDHCQPDELHLIDIDLKPLYDVGDKGLLEKAKAHEGDSSAILGTFPDGYFDWVYIDGDHSYEGVQRDAEVARLKVRPGGLLIFHDFTMWSPAECIDYGIPHVVCELSVNFGWKFVYFALDPLMYCAVALRRPE
ncbi:MAG: class I SAM-dependent methyltransferase [Thermoguttaceae bacterium]